MQSKKANNTFPPYTYSLDPLKYKICGIDEVGRGPLMGDVVSACVILDPQNPIAGLTDSKALSEKKRNYLYELIQEKALAFGIGRASPCEIDQLNILNATYLSMLRAYENMQYACDLALIDGNKIPKHMPLKCECVVKGDLRVQEISAASILAKVTRDQDLYNLDHIYPEYGFKKHKGYPTKEHLLKLEKLAILDCYRKSFAPIKKILAQKQDIEPLFKA